LSGLLFGIVFPFGGLLASSAILVTGAAFFLALARALIAIRRGDVARHREWMIRMFAIGLGISTVRIVGLFLFLVIPARSLELRMGLSFWIGFALTFGAAEFWVRHTRLPRVTVQSRTTTAQIVPGEPRLNIAQLER
jgi:4-hydroxybenzoate polyprenyltransferase